MTPQEIVAILLSLFSGKPWVANDLITITATESMNFAAKKVGDTIVVNWSPPYPVVTGHKFGFSVAGTLKGAVIHRDRIVPEIDGLPDIAYEF